MSFSALPAEIRLQILHDLFVFDHPISLPQLHAPPHDWVWHALEADREFRSQGSRILFSRNTFRLEILTQHARPDDLVAHSTRAQLVSLPRLSHWPPGHTVQYTAAVPLPRSGAVWTHRRRPVVDGGSGNISYSARYHVTKAAIPPQSWDAARLVRRVQVAAPRSVGRLWWEEAELACRMVELLCTAYLPGLEAVELDLSAPLAADANVGAGAEAAAPSGWGPMEALFVVGRSRLEVRGRQCGELQRAVRQRVKQAAKMAGVCGTLGDDIDFDVVTGSAAETRVGEAGS